MDWKELILWSLKRWYWFAVSLCLTGAAGITYFMFTAPTYTVSASLMLRQTSDNKRTTQEELMNIMGYEAKKNTGDEVEVLISRSLMRQVAEKLNLTVTYYHKNSRYWQCQYPQHPFTAVLPDTLNKSTDFDIRVADNGTWKLKIPTGRFSSETYTLNNPQLPLQTVAGTIRFTFDKPVPAGHYRVHFEPMIWAVENNKSRIAVSRLAKESNVIQLSAQTTSPQLMEDVINTLLDTYNREATTDKNFLAVQTGQFLDDRLTVLAAELQEAEEALEQFKRVNRISDLDHTAEAYRNLSDQYQRKIAQMDAEVEVLDFIGKQITLPENENSLLPANLGVSDATLQDLIQTYNAQIRKRTLLLQTASDDNPSVLLLTQQIQQTRTNLTEAIAKSKQSISLLRAAEESQQKQYDLRLGAMPEQEKRYLEMKRVCTTKEKQYMYLIQKRESNTLLLASDAVPAKIIDRAQRNPIPDGPRLKLAMMEAFVLGMLFPLLFYFLALFRREYLQPAGKRA